MDQNYNGRIYNRVLLTVYNKDHVSTTRIDFFNRHESVYFYEGFDTRCLPDVEKQILEDDEYLPGNYLLSVRPIVICGSVISTNSAVAVHTFTKPGK